jgi:hypothetical protein
LNTTDESTCDIKQSTDLAALLNKTSLILWDEAPMTHMNCFEALDKSLRDILRCRDKNNDKKPFGGMTIAWWRFQTNTSCGTKRKMRTDSKCIDQTFISMEPLQGI